MKKTVMVCLAALLAVLSCWGQAPAGVPKDATPLGPYYSAPGIDGAAVKAMVVGSVKTQITNANTVAAGVYATACSNWTLAAKQNRDYGITPAPKPVAPASQVVHTQDDGTGAVGITSITWTWITSDGPAVGTCPDLPPLAPPAAPGTVAIGLHVWDTFWQATTADTMPDGVIAQGTSADGVTGTWKRSRVPWGAGYWVKQ